MYKPNPIDTSKIELPEELLGDYYERKCFCGTVKRVR